MLMHRQAPIALSALAACAVMASGAVLLRQQILDFSSLSQVRDSVEAPQLAIPHERAAKPRAAAAAPGHAPRRRPARTGAAATAVVIDALAIAGRVTLAVPAGRSGPTDANGRALPAPGTPAPSAPTAATVSGPGFGNAAARGPEQEQPQGSRASPAVAGLPGVPGGPSSSPFAQVRPPAPPGAVRVAAQPAELAPEGDRAPVVSSADNALPDGRVPAPTPTPSPVDSAPVDQTPPAPDPTPPADAPPAETPPPVAEPPAAGEPPQAPAPEAPSAPADPAPPADPASTTDPPPVPTIASTTVGTAAASAAGAA